MCPFRPSRLAPTHVVTEHLHHAELSEQSTHATRADDLAMAAKNP